MTTIATAVGSGRLDIEASPGEPIELRHVSRRGVAIDTLFLTTVEAREVARLLRLAADAVDRRSTEIVSEQGPTELEMSRRLASGATGRWAHRG